ncbi:MAG TPA: response regulator [Vicinamibacterales bacterium]|nr:response regulator [Vicinamibacterales bacterium]
MADAPSRKRVLVVDDDAALLEAVRRGLEAANIAVTACTTFEDARRALREKSFDALITDVRLGAFNGLQLAVVARTYDPGISVIVFSGFDDPVLREEAERAGGAYFVKPVHVAELLRYLNREK